MKFCQTMLGLSLVVCSAIISPQASGQVGRHHQSVESLVANANFVALGKLVGVRRQDTPTKNGNPRLFIQPVFSEVLIDSRGQRKFDELESSFTSSSVFYQKLIDDKISGAWFINIPENGQVSVNPPGWQFFAFQKLDGYVHPLFAPPMLSNDLSVLTTQDAIFKRLRECCNNRLKKANGKAPAIVGAYVPRWLVSQVGAADGNSMSFVVDEMCEKTAKRLVENPIEFLRSRQVVPNDVKLFQAETLGLKLLQHFPSEQNTVLVRGFLHAPIRKFELSSNYLPLRIRAYEILLKWGVAVDRPKFWETITDLNLSNSDVNDKTMVLLGQLSNLKQLNLKNTQVTQAGLMQLRHLRHLSLIELENHQVTDDIIQVLSEIDLLYTISAVGWRHIDGVEVRSGLIKAIDSLKLGESPLTDRGLNAFSSFENVVWINLTGTAVSDIGLDSLSRMSELKTIFVGGTRVTDLGVRKITQFKKLETLTLTNLQISDVALAYLESLPSLGYLNLEGTKVSPEAVARLQIAIPDCKIVPPRVDEKTID